MHLIVIYKLMEFELAQVFTASDIYLQDSKLTGQVGVASISEVLPVVPCMPGRLRVIQPWFFMGTTPRFISLGFYCHDWRV